MIFIAITTFNCAHVTPKVQTTNETLSTIQFRFDSDELLEKYKARLDDAIEAIKESPANRILISGYTDKNGEDDYNLDLGDRRARSILGYLEQEGISSDRVIVVTYGETQSSAMSYSESQLERKVVLSVLKSIQ